MGRQVTLNEQMEKFIDDIEEFTQGDLYKSADEILEDALYLLREHWDAKAKEFGESLHRAAAQKGIPADEVKREVAGWIEEWRIQAK